MFLHNAKEPSIGLIRSPSIALIILVLGILLNENMVWGDVTLRNQIAVFKYAGDERIFDSYFYLLTSRSETMLEELMSGPIRQRTDPKHLKQQQYFELQYIEDLEYKVIDPPVKFEHKKKKQLETYWVENNLIEILYGAINSNPHTTGITIHTSIYLGGYGDHRQGMLVHMRDHMRNQNSDQFLNHHHMAAAYAMAVEAKNKNKPDWVVARLLRQAYELGGSLTQEQSETVQALIKKINTELEILESKSYE